MGPGEVEVCGGYVGGEKTGWRRGRGPPGNVGLSLPEMLQ